MENENPTYIGTQQGWGSDAPVALSAHDRRQHMYVVGKTGSGKTTLLRNMILQDIEAGRGVGVIDPHGDLAHEILDCIPPSRTDDVVYFNPADTDFPIGFNILHSTKTDTRHLVASSVVGIFKSIWRDSWGPRLEYILYACVASLLECENVTLLGIQRMLMDERYRLWIVRHVRDPFVRAFWEREFSQYDNRFATEAIAPIQNKVGQLLMSPPLRNILGQVRRRIDPRFMMDNQRILIANLSKGLLGEDKSNLMGAVLVSAFQQAAMSRVDVPDAERPDFNLYIDEFQNFNTDSIASVLSEARKYHLSLTLSHQFTSQLAPEIRGAVFGNVGSIVSFRVGYEDARLLEQEFSGEYPARRFTELAAFEVCAKLLIDGVHRTPFMGKTLPPFGNRYGKRENLIRRSREKYATPRRRVEGKLNRWLNR